MTEQTTVYGTIPAGIVADDLTGATDSAVQFARDGWKARLALTMPQAGSAESGSVVAVVTDARAQAVDTARAATASAVVGLRESGVRRLFLKIDSTLRGSVIGQVNGALDGWSQEHPDAIAVVCSAYPAMGRTIENGHILVDGEGVHTTAIGRDPVTPVITSELAELLPGSVGIRLSSADAAENAARLETAGSRIVTVDAITDEDLARLAEAIAHLGARAIPVGAAGLAVAVSHVWSDGLPVPAGVLAERGQRVVIVGSSLHDVSRAQLDHLTATLPADLLLTLSPALDETLQPSTIAGWTARRLAASPALPPVVVIASPSERPSEALGEPGKAASELIAESLAIITEAVFEHDRIDAFMLLGGEGARAVLSRLGAESLLVRDTIREGIPLGVIEGGKAHGVTVVTKAGGFGTPTSVADIVPELLSAGLLGTELTNTELTNDPNTERRV